MRTLAVVPIKSFSSAKQRLASALADGARASLAHAMFADVLGALRRTRAITAVAVVTGDVSAEAIGRGDGAIVLADDRGSGQSDATRIGIDYALREGFTRVTLIPGDTPLLEARELDALLDRLARDEIDVAIVPDRHGTGTNALVITPPDAFAPSFGPGSRERHVEAARASGLAYRTLEVPSLALDVDTPEDLADLRPRLAAARGIASRTRGAISQLERSGALGHASAPIEV